MRTKIAAEAAIAADDAEAAEDEAAEEVSAPVAAAPAPVPVASEVRVKTTATKKNEREAMMAASTRRPVKSTSNPISSCRRSTCSSRAAVQ